MIFWYSQKNNAYLVWGQKPPILHVSVSEGNLTGFNIFTIFIDAINENANLKQKLNETQQKVAELESKIFLFSEQKYIISFIYYHN